jgi:hypothetical protein
VGEHAAAVQGRLRDALAAARPDREWGVEYRVAGTPVDVAGVGDDGLALVELEWRRADPADNAAKLFRHLAAGEFDAADVVVCQAFTGYYDLASGGVSAKRENAEFVGGVAARTYDRFSYHPVELPLHPPKRGGDLPGGWREVVDDAADRVDEILAGERGDA